MESKRRKNLQRKLKIEGLQAFKLLFQVKYFAYKVENSYAWCLDFVALAQIYP